MGWLGLLNFMLLQWIFVRLAKEVDTKSKKIVKWKLLIGIVPLTGWWNDYIYIYRNKDKK